MNSTARKQSWLALLGWVGITLACSAMEQSPSVGGDSVEIPNAPAPIQHTGKFDAAGVEETLVRVRVVSKDGHQPVPGVEVTMCPQATNTDFGMTALDEVAGSRATSHTQIPKTDENGLCEFVVEPGVEHDAIVVDDAHGSVGARLAPLARGELRKLELRVPTVEDLEFRGRLLDAATGAPISDGSVKFCINAGVREVRSNADGRFELRARSWYDNFASAVAPGYGSVEFGIRRGHESEDQALDIRLGIAAALDVHVQAPDGVHLHSLKVLVTNKADVARSQLGSDLERIDDAWVVKMRSDGHAILGGLPPNEPLYVIVRERGDVAWRELEPIKLAPGETRSLEVVIGSGAAIRGRLQDMNGAPIAYHTVCRAVADREGPQWLAATTRVEETHTDANGRFNFDAVEPGMWLVGCIANHDGFERDESDDVPPLAECVRIERNGPDVSLVLTRPRALFIRGRVLDAEGRSLAECAVDGDSSVGDAHATTDSGGGFILGPLTQGEWRLTARSFGTDNAPSAGFVTHAGDEKVEIRMRRAAELRVHVACSDGRAPTQAGAQLTLLDTHADASPRIPVRDDGLVTFRSLSPGRYSLSVWNDEDMVALRDDLKLDTGPNAQDLDVTLEPGARVVLHYDGLESCVMTQVKAGGALVNVGGMYRGFASGFAVPVGEVEVVFTEWTSKRIEQRVLIIEAGEVRDVVWDGMP